MLRLRVLNALRTGPARTEALVAAVPESAKTVRAALGELEKEGFVRRIPPSGDGRVREFVLTLAGRRELKWAEARDV